MPHPSRRRSSVAAVTARPPDATLLATEANPSRSTLPDKLDMSTNSTARSVLTCDCGATTHVKVSWTDENPGRRFTGCPNYRTGACQFFEWIDPPMLLRLKLQDLFRQNNELFTQVENLKNTVRDLKNRNENLKIAVAEGKTRKDILEKRIIDLKTKNRVLKL